MKIDVIMLSYNKAEFIEQSIESILQQSGDYLNKIIIADDCSIDNSVSIIERYVAKFPDQIQLIKNPVNFGTCKNIRMAIKNVTAPLVTNASCDDYFCSKDKFKQQIEFMLNNPDFVACANSLKIVDINGEDKNIIYPGIKPSENMNVIEPIKLYYRYGPIITMGTILAKSEILKQCYLDIFDGTFIEDLPSAYLLLQFGKVGFIPEPLNAYRQYNQSSFNGKNKIFQLAYAVQTRLLLQRFLNGDIAHINHMCLRDNVATFLYNLNLPENNGYMKAVYEWIYSTNDHVLINLLLGDLDE